ncbi:MAG: Crp/Fnr family transcriptional regulator [Peptostreptococcaceae bacterium]
MFKTKSKNEIKDILKDFNYITTLFSKNDIIALEGEPCTRVGLILDGSIDIKRILNSSSTIHISSLFKGNLFGEIIAFSDTKTYPATVIAATDSEIIFLGKDEFIKFCTTHPIFLEMFLNDLTNKILTLNKSITSLSLTTIKEKIAHFLIVEYNTQSTPFIRLNMTKQKLSEMLGIPRPSLSRELINMKNLGLIDYSKDYIKILDLESLRSILMQ